MNGPDPALRDFVERSVGSVVRWRNVSWDHAESEVWEAHCESASEAKDARAFLKVHRQPGKFRAEAAAYRDWTASVGDTPRLLAERPSAPHALLLDAAPGAPLLTAASGLTLAAQASHYERAGRWLARLHALPHEDADPMNVAEALVARSEAWSRRAAGLIDPETIRAVHAAVEAPWPTDTPIPARVRCHRDYTARNWLVDGATFNVIDFEHSRPDWSLVDVERVGSSLEGERDRGALWEAFGRGYGKALKAAESSGALRRLALLAALCQVTWAVEHGDEPFEHAGRTRLARLRRLQT